MPKQRWKKEELIFKERGTFSSVYAAQAWLERNGYSYGSMDANNPIGILIGEWDLPQKWHNFKAADKSSIDGIMTSNDWREGEVKVILYK